MSTKVYTRTGDQGETCLIGGRRTSKADVRLEASGSVDELNSSLGAVVSEIRRASAGGGSVSREVALELVSSLEKIQSSLFDLGSHVSCEDPALAAKLPQIHDDDISELEGLMDRYTLILAPLKNFILPGGSPAASAAHMARTIARRAERACVRVGAIEPVLIRYLNRLSDYCFVLARYLNHLSEQPEILWRARR